MEGGRSQRKSLRAPVYLDVRCDFANGNSYSGKMINLGTEGAFIKTADPIRVGEYLTIEFLLPGTLTSIRQEGEVVWTRTYDESEEQSERIHAAGIKFVDLEEPHREAILDFTLKMLDSPEVIQSEGILRILDDIRNLPSMDRLKAYNVLIKKGSGPML